MSHRLVPLQQSSVYKTLLQIPIISTDDENEPLSKDIMIIPLEKSRETLGTDEYKARLSAFIKSILLKYVVDDQAIVDQVVSETTFPLWLAAFTDYSYDPNPDMNYERLEKIGDIAAKAAFNLYLQDYQVSKEEDAQLGPARGVSKGKTTLSQAEISNLSNYYMSKLPQAQVAQRLGMKDYIRSTSPVVLANLEDVFESFVGALYRSAFSAGVSREDLVYNLIVSIFTEEPIDLYDALGDDKTRVLQYATRRGWMKPVINPPIQSNGTMMVLIELPDQKYLNVLRHTKGVNGAPSPIIGRGTGNTALVAEKNAFIDALALWERYGFFKEDIMSDSLRVLYEKALAKAKAEGYVNILPPVKLRSTKEYQIEGLLGVEPDGNRVYLKQVQVRAKPGQITPREEMASILYKAYLGLPITFST